MRHSWCYFSFVTNPVIWVAAFHLSWDALVWILSLFMRDHYALCYSVIFFYTLLSFLWSLLLPFRSCQFTLTCMPSPFILCQTFVVRCPCMNSVFVHAKTEMSKLAIRGAKLVPIGMLTVCRKAPSLSILSIYINVYAITIHIMPDTFGYIWLAVSATTVILRGCYAESMSKNT
jgi:hypothetical protein